MTETSGGNKIGRTEQELKSVADVVDWLAKIGSSAYRGKMVDDMEMVNSALYYLRKHRVLLESAEDGRRFTVTITRRST